MPDNYAAWILAKQAKPLEVRPAPYVSPGPHEIVIKSAAVGINPVDWVVQEAAVLPTEYPGILGQDVAGAVVEVGAEVTRFKPGDRVFGNAVVSSKRLVGNAFQLYPILPEDIACPIPHTMSFEAACVLPLGSTTAAAGLYLKGYLGLPYPSLSPTPRNEVVLVWGGASSVGSNGIQLAKASGYEVMTTCSPKNYEYVRQLGATQVFDYASPTIINDIVTSLQTKRLAGTLDCISSHGACEACINILSHLPSTHHRFIASVLPVPDTLPEGIKADVIWGNLHDTPLAKPIYEDYLPKALEEGKYIAAPEAEVVGEGLEAIQGAFEAQKKVSAKKIVVKL